MAELPHRLYDLSRAVLDCAASSLGSTAPSRKFVAPGTAELLAWDHCCGQGMLAVQLIMSYPTSSFPAQDQAPNICGVPYIAHLLGITLLRCTPVGTAQAAPTPKALTDAAEQELCDVERLQAGLVCCFSDKASMGALLGNGFKWVLGQLLTLGPDGGCAGIQQQLTVGLPTCFECC